MVLIHLWVRGSIRGCNNLQFHKIKKRLGNNGIKLR